jgi:hypothetical protein
VPSFEHRERLRVRLDHHVTVTATGVEELVVVPLPSSPELLSPQHSTVPPESSAQAD